jgi:hypothetical protein
VKTTNLVRLAQSDQFKLGSLCNLLDQLAIRLRNWHSIDVQSFDAAIISVEGNPCATPVLGTCLSGPPQIPTTNDARFLDKRIGEQLLGSQMIWSMFLHHGQRTKLVRFVAFLGINEDHALKSITSRIHHWKCEKKCSQDMSSPWLCQTLAGTRKNSAQRNMYDISPFPLRYWELSFIDGSL